MAHATSTALSICGFVVAMNLVSKRGPPYNDRDGFGVIVSPADGQRNSSDERFVMIAARQSLQSYMGVLNRNVKKIK